MSSIPKHFGRSVLSPDLFIGRDKDLTEVHRKLFQDDHNALLLVNGQGGVGKTTLASRYYHQYEGEFQHLAWVLVENSLIDAVLTLASRLGLSFDPKMLPEERFQHLVEHMRNLEGPNLLIIDNANGMEDLKENILGLRSLTNFKLLITTRIETLGSSRMHRVGHLDKTSAFSLFYTLYKELDVSSGNTLEQIFAAVDYNTLVIELLAKNMEVLNRFKNAYSLEQLLADIQQKGLLAFRQGGSVDTVYQSHSPALREATPEAIIEAMYDISPLEELDKQLLSILALLPAENISFAHLEELLPDISQLDQTLNSLYQKGWIEFSRLEKSFRCSPVVQEIVRRQNKGKLAAHASSFIDKLEDAIDDSLEINLFKGEDFEKTSLYVRYGESIIAKIKNGPLQYLTQYVGNFYFAIGDLVKALNNFQLMQVIMDTLHQQEPENLNLKNGLAISYSKLAETHSELGNLDKALTFFQKRSTIGLELFEASPQNVTFKNGLAISYQKLGDTHSALGNLDKALTFFQQYHQLEAQLFEEFPQNVTFKHGLAISFSKLGGTHSRLGNLDKALTFFQNQKVLFEQLLREYPQNVAFKNGLAISFSRLGDTHSKLGDLDKALTFFQQYNQLEAQLFKKYPQNIDFKNGLAVSYANLGNTHSALGNLDKALTFFQQYHQLKVQLFKAYPQNVNFKNGLAISYYNLGVFYKEQKQSPKTAQKWYLKAQSLWEELNTSFPNHVEFQRNLASVKKRLENLNES